MSEILALDVPGSEALFRHVRQKRLSVASLLLTAYRNYASLALEVDASLPVVLTGHNGAGKTNLLEAISLLTPGRGLRRAQLAELQHVKGEGQSWAVAAQVEGMDGATRIGTGGDPASDGPDKRVVRIDSKPAKSQNELARHFSVLWLTPQMDQLFQESPSSRRRFLDRLVYAFDPEHAARVSAYEYAMRERNRLLGMPSGADAAWLGALEQKMAENGCAIALARINTVERLNNSVMMADNAFPPAEIRVEGWVENLILQGEKALAAEQAFQAFLASCRRADAQAGRALSGVHRSEMLVRHVVKDMEAQYCSTGEQKALLLTIILAQARAGAMWSGVIPVLLLDEVVAHLDAARRAQLFDAIDGIGAQAWMTGTDTALFEARHQKWQFLHVNGGCVTKE